ncbi:NAD-dependent epimerase/dehydratase family protein [Pseudalkalibacillus salsuginis]|uniref:NAD-dependent epimerase/dehydratase family protein n=1 Tax=Pseudalkalibacillus salsuginis TaxID=2910972 RepID=UPI001F2E5931|nr:NAD-dependent epimerase/dehydratase family protein [Pseudalkalibacillus salsuginis]MCF6409154.1 NAD-dependent epimerase/dehydratase family protein [Pseudalkalibacillus salsuginis]
MPASKKRILITGASGFTGVHAVKLAHQSELKVICTSRSPQPSSPIPFKQCDLTDYAQIEGIIKSAKPHYVLHLAGFNDARRSWETPHTCLENNILGTLNLLEAVRLHIPKSKILIIGSALQYSLCSGEKPPHPYSLSKTLQTLLSKEWKRFYDMNIAVAKPSNLIGPGHSQGICSKVAKEIVIAEKNNEPVRVHLYNSLSECDFVDVRDAVKAYLMILMSESEFDHFDIGSGQSRTLENLMDNFKLITTQPIRITKDHSHATDPVGLDLRLVRSLGWKPEYTLQSTLNDILSFYKSIVQ